MKKYVWKLAWYSYTDDSLVGEDIINIQDDDVRRIFSRPDDQYLVDNLEVTAEHVAELERLWGKKIDLQYAFELEARTV